LTGKTIPNGEDWGSWATWPMIIGVINVVIGFILIKDIEEQFKPVAVNNDPYYEIPVIIINYY